MLDDYIISGPKVIVNEWPSLREAGFESVDAILPHPKDNSEASFFSGQKYALVNIKSCKHIAFHTTHQFIFFSSVER
jgi:hypothetical protein